MNGVGDAREDMLSFGPFNLSVGQRLLAKDGVPVDLGSRALDLLVALTLAPNVVVSKQELISRVWPDVIVDEGSLRFHMTGLRKALGDGHDGARYITTVAGRGYCFVAPISRSTHLRQDHAASDFRHALLPSRLDRMVGREQDVLALSEKLMTSRMVTIVGVGGVGKTTVATAVAHHLAPSFNGAVVFADYGMLSDPGLVPAGIASMLGLSVGSNDVRPSLIAYLREKQIMLVLDTCEHLIDAIADLVATIIDAAPNVFLLATSREALRIEAESVYRLDTLACPPDDPELSTDAVLAFPATKLFVERAAASGATLKLNDQDARVVAGICRKLDGMALALELAARRVESYGLHQTARLLGQHLTLGWAGSRTAPPRQKTLQATLDWSFGLLTDIERTVLRRLAVFVGNFTLDAALEVLSGSDIAPSVVFGAIDNLVAKSLLATHPLGATMRYRLLDTTRAYAIQCQTDEDRAGLNARHAAYYQRWLEQYGPDWPTLSTGPERLPYFVSINNVRAALEWAFGEQGDIAVGIRLAAAAVSVFQVMSLFPECQRWSQRALLALNEEFKGSAEEMHLQAGLGISQMYLQGGLEAPQIALGRGLSIAEDRGNAIDQLRILGLLHMFNLRTGDFYAALAYARRCSSIASTLDDPSTVELGHFFLGNSLHFTGDLGNARSELEAAARGEPQPQRTPASYVGFEGKHLAGGILARNLWLQGYSDQADIRARKTIGDAAKLDHSLTLCIALLGGIAVFLWRDDVRSAEEHIEWLISRAGLNSLSPYVSVARGFEGELAIRRGDVKLGIDTLRRCIERLHNSTYEVFTTMLELSLVKGLAVVGEYEEGFSRINKAIELVERNGDLCYWPELLRIKATLLLSTQSIGEAEACLVSSIEKSTKMGAHAWELRTATDLAALWIADGRLRDALKLLQAVLEPFDEGLDTADVIAAKSLLATVL
ncbi:putative ATPase/DNA-binding winged helix-turn-helix (wHTH) protein [Pararhizobium capsulatum DSM 1112]|uniref:ATPase/DNA-binding winged helix-turn-helix (WHTH) protein n=1 Tax=Pararhizobium capsulatum DSM 1112 TaxID=1121113 RepID=A0ABU0BPU0_9HYPH|nr:winged helix-turn-helix domain-containing protein [Pararhizobium capsulatum]MDQ0320266.1 putative ATPase/DNA-binding winged helix-turn-helix (wHTH) protein [Pararhizobium capsulatum DSM 1112]